MPHVFGPIEPEPEQLEEKHQEPEPEQLQIKKNMELEPQKKIYNSCDGS